MKDIGIDVNPPTGEWDGDENCPFFGSLRLRGQVFEGIVDKVGMLKTVVVTRERVRYVEKFERYEKRTGRISAHLPSCVGELNIGDKVKIMECRPISKTVSFCVVEGGSN